MNSHKNLFAFDDGSFQKGKGKEACQGCYVAIPSQCFILVVYDAMETSIFLVMRLVPRVTHVPAEHSLSIMCYSVFPCLDVTSKSMRA